MTNPKSLVFYLHKYWDVVDELTRATRACPAFSQEQVLSAITKVESELQDDERFGVMRSLCNSELLLPLPRTDDLQLNPLVLDFVRGIIREHELGLSSVLQAG